MHVKSNGSSRESNEEKVSLDTNTIIIHQIPRSPFTNLLDLGVWCSLQSRVEKQHYQKQTDVHALAKSVMDTWNNDKNLNHVISHVWKRLRNVLALIVEGGGGNDLVVETKRGKKFRNFTRIFGRQLNYVATALAAAPPTTITAAAPTDTFTLQSNNLEDTDDEDDDDIDIPLPLVNKVENIATAGNIQIL